MDSKDMRPYRPCVGIMLMNGKGEIFVGNRINIPGENWQMPQGGIDKGEDSRAAAMRELAEETGIQKARILAESPQWHAYDLPPELSKKIWKGRYRGQKQKWFLMRFEGDDREINLTMHAPEFSEWRWTPLHSLCALIVAFKRPVYEKLIQEFEQTIRENLAD